MATIQRFEDMIAWQKARELTKEVYKAFQNCRDFGFIAEGFESGTRQEFLNYLYISKASAGEVRAQLYAALDIEYLNIETFKYLNSLAGECSKLIASFIKSLKTSEFGGLQFKREKTKGQLETEKFLDDLKEKYLKDRPEFNKD